MILQSAPNETHMAHVEEANTPRKEKYSGPTRTIDLSDVVIRGLSPRPLSTATNEWRLITIPEGTKVNIPASFPITDIPSDDQIDDGTLSQIIASATGIQFPANIQVDISFIGHDEPVLTTNDPVASWLLAHFYETHNNFILVFKALDSQTPTVTIDHIPLTFNHEPISPGATIHVPEFV